VLVVNELEKVKNQLLVANEVEYRQLQGQASAFLTLLKWLTEPVIEKKV
jgi:hypothetical protein